MISQLGLSGSTLGTDTFGLGTDGSPPFQLRQGATFVALKTMTPARVNRVAAEAVVYTEPAARVSSLTADALITVQLPYIRMDNEYVEAVTLATPSLRITEVFAEAIIHAPPTRFGKTFAMLAAVRPRSAAHATVRLRSMVPLEQERVGNVYVLMRFASQSGGLPLPNPTVAPVVTVIAGPGAGTVPPGTYQVGYTWVDIYGQTQISPLTTVVVTTGGSGLIVEVPENAPVGATGYQVYITPQGNPAAPPQQATPAPTPIYDPGIPPVTPTVITGPPDFHALPSPVVNNTGYSLYAFDHDFRDPGSPCAPGTLGWRPPGIDSRIVVVRSGEGDLATLPVGPPDANGTGTWVYNQLPAAHSPYTELLSRPVDDSAQQTLGAGSIGPGVYWTAFTWLDPNLNESPLSTAYLNTGFQILKSQLIVPAGQVAQWTFEFPITGAFAVPPIGVNFYVSTAPDSTPTQEASGFYYTGPAASTFVRQNSSPILAADMPWTISSLTTSGAHPPVVSTWPPADAPNDGLGQNWTSPDYVIPGPDFLGQVWHRPHGGFSRKDHLQGQDQGIADYDPHWRALPTAAVLCDYARLVEDTSLHVAAEDPTLAGFGPTTYYRHVWMQPGTVTADALLTMRYNGTLSEVYLNGTPINGRVVAVLPPIGGTPPAATSTFRALNLWVGGAQLEYQASTDTVREIATPATTYTLGAVFADAAGLEWDWATTTTLTSHVTASADVAMGVNITGICHYGHGDLLPASSNADITADLDVMAALGMRLIRVWAGNKHIDDDEAARRLSKFLDLAASRNLKVIVALCDEYPTGFSPQGMDGFYSGGVLTSAFFNGGYTDRYLTFLRRVVTVNRGKSALYAWEPGNELKFPSDATAFTDFMNAAASAIRAIDGSTPIATGMVGAWHTSLTPSALYSALSGYQIITGHAYNGDRATAADAAWATAHGKVFLLEEFGYPGTGDRSTAIRSELAYWHGQDPDIGVLQWGFIASTMDDNGDGDNNVGWDNIWHSADYTALAAIYAGSTTAAAGQATRTLASFAVPIPATGVAGTSGTMTSVPPESGTRYWQTAEYVLPASVFVTGKNVLAFKTHTSTAMDYASNYDGAVDADGSPMFTTTFGESTHVRAFGDQWGTDAVVMASGDLKQGLGATRPDGTSRQAWTAGQFATQGAGFRRGRFNAGFLSWGHNPMVDDDGPGFWGFYGDTHQPEFFVKGTWDGGVHEASTAGDRTVYGPVGGKWGPRDDGFGVPPGDPTPHGPDIHDAGQTWQDVYLSDVFNAFSIGDTKWELFADRFNMISVGRIGGGGHVQLGATIPGLAGPARGMDLSASMEWAPGAAFLLTIPAEGVPFTERTVFNERVRVDNTFPFDADPFGHGPDFPYPAGFAPWTRGRVIATVPVDHLSEVFISAVSRDPSAGNLGKARMWVFWLTASQQVGGILCNDNEFLHSTFGVQPATLWPYSENHFWLADHFGTGAWGNAKFLQIVMFNHQENFHASPQTGLHKYNEWLINLTVRERLPTALARRPRAQWA